jgi:hypothetical protein
MIDATLKMLHDASSQGHGSVFVIFMIGVFFGGIIQYARVDKFEKIAGFAMLEDTTVPKMLFLTVGLASIGFYFMQELGFAHYHVKPMMMGGLVIGGVIFGISMAILGKCPGTGPISIAEGRIDVLVGAIGGILGGAVFTIFYPFFKQIMGPDFGKLIIPEFFTGNEHIIVLLFGILLTMISIIIPNREYLDKEDNEISV